MNGHRFRVWAGRDGIMFVSCFSVSIVVSEDTNIIPSLPTHTLNLCPFILICLHTHYNKAKVIR